MLSFFVLALLIASCDVPTDRGQDIQAGDSSPPSSEARPPGNAPRATLTPAQLKALLKDYGKLTTLSIEYSIRMRPTGPADDGSESGVHRRLTAKAPCFLVHDSGHMSKALDWRDDPYRQTCYFDNSRETIFYHFNRAFARRPYDATMPLDGTLATEFFFVSTGIWPLPGRRFPRPTDCPYLLTEVAESEGHDRVRDGLEDVDGTWCHVLVNEGKDTLWIDASRGARLLKREVCSSSSGVLMARYTLARHKELLPGVWCPMDIRSEQFDFDASSPEARKRHVVDSEAVLSTSSINLPDENCFSFAPEPGWLQYNMEDVRARPAQEVPGGEGILDDLAGWITRHRMTPVENKQIHNIQIYQIFVLIVLVSVVEWIMWSRRRRGHHRNNIKL